MASVKFNEILETAVEVNLLGTKKTINLTSGIEKLKAFVHCSTLYSNCNRMEIDEKIYEHILSYHQLVTVAKCLKNLKDKSDFEQLIFQGLPNTYTLSKHFAEKLVYHQAFFMPTGIFRPPVVIGSYKDCPGYTDNLYGPSGIVAWTTRG
jgi:alcohol-forming fatty acyl-CoA reductase